MLLVVPFIPVWCRLRGIKKRFHVCLFTREPLFCLMSGLQNSESLSAGVLCDIAQLFLDSEELVVLCQSVGAAH